MLSVSDPDSPSYGKYLSMDEMTEIGMQNERN